MKKFTKVIAIVLVLATLVCVFASCGKKLSGEYYLGDKTVTKSYTTYVFSGSKVSVSVYLLGNKVGDDSFEGKSIEYVMERYWDITTDFEVGTDNKENYGHLIVYMLLFEPGYLRLDDDKDNESEGTHPLNHIDVNYANPNTYKIGLPNKWTCERMIDFVNIKKPCSVISD